MQKKTHLLFGFLLFLVAYHFFNISPVLALFATFGAYFPDIDYLIDKKWFPKFLKRLTWTAVFKRGMHRTLLHNVWMLGLFTFIFYYLSNVTYALIFAMGYFSHLFMDSFTKSGIYWIWPFGDKKLFKRKRLHFKGLMVTGSFSEKVFQYVLTVIIVLVIGKWIF